MSYIGQLFGYGKSAASSSTSSPPGPELIPGWEVYKNQRGEILYGNNLIPACQFNAPVAQAQTAPVAQAQSASRLSSGQEPKYPSWYSPDQQREAHDDWLRQNMLMNPHFNGGLKRKQSRRKQSRRKQSRRKQSRRRS